MRAEDFINNPKRIALLLAAFNQLSNIVSDGDMPVDDFDYENNERGYQIASTKLSLEIDYPDESWSKLEFAIENDDNDFVEISDIPWGTRGVLYVYDSLGKYSEWWI